MMMKKAVIKKRKSLLHPLNYRGGLLSPLNYETVYSTLEFSKTDQITL
jgi:hypothetical protein